MTKRRPYDREADEARQHVREVEAKGLTADEVARVNAQLAAWRAEGHHHAIAIGRGWLVCPTCEVDWPCPPAKKISPSTR